MLTFVPSRALPVVDDSKYWDDADNIPRSLGCEACRELSICGGLHASGKPFSCLDYCCGSPTSCERVCKKNAATFVDRIREIGGFGFEDVPRVASVPFPTLSNRVPLIYHRGKRRERFSGEVVALQLKDLVSRRTGLPKFGSRSGMCAYFGISDSSQILVHATSKDGPLERHWQLGEHRVEVYQNLRILNIAAVTSPNYSLFSDVPRWDDLHALKRIATSWSEMASQGLAAALHVNARTATDWERWSTFVAQRPEIAGLSYEFGTGASFGRRMAWHVEGLCKVARAAGRPLTLVTRGGVHALPALRHAFSRVAYVDTVCFMKTIKRQFALRRPDGSIRWSKSPSPDVSMDELLQRNDLVLSGSPSFPHVAGSH
jgi:hypothetical protein